MGRREGQKRARERKRERKNARSRGRQGGREGVFQALEIFFTPGTYGQTCRERERRKGRKGGRKGGVHRQIVVADLLSTMHEEASIVFSKGLFSLQA